ncbi:MAG: hypothetical protein AABZ60_17585 [Planctomycetota bacterium]
MDKIVQSESHQGLFWVHSQQLFRQGYETLEQVLSVFPTPVPFDSYLLPDTDKLANYLDFSALLLEDHGTQLSASSYGDIHSSQGWYFVIWEMASWAWASSLYKNLPTPATNEKTILALLKNLVESQKQFQYANELDADQDGVGEYGWLQELSGRVPLRNSSLPTKNPFLPPWIGFQAQQQQGTILSSGYCFKMYLPSISGPALHEPEFFEWSPNSVNSSQDADLQELCWIAYAWPFAPGKTGKRCFAVNQNGDFFVSEDSPYQGWHFIPSPEACFMLGKTSLDNKKARNLEGTFPSSTIPALAYDGFCWSQLEAEQ